MTPVVPDIALYSGSARLSGNSWNPGELVMRVIGLGANSPAHAESVWASLNHALSVTDADDVWARWLQAEFEGRREPGCEWKPAPLSTAATVPPEDKAGMRVPAMQFVRDLEAIVGAKERMTRRQWISLLEAVLRLGTAAHVLWLCGVNDRLWQLTREVLKGKELPLEREVRALVLQSKEPPLVHGALALPVVRDLASRYLAARIGLNLILWKLEEGGHKVDRLSSAADVLDFLTLVEEHSKSLDSGALLTQLSELRDVQARTIACKKGIGSNIVEFCRHALGQRQTADGALRGFDQGYQLRKKAEYASAPWVVSLGPVAVIGLVHCCLADASGPRSIKRLREHLSWYGIGADVDDIATSDLGRTLRLLGLVLDSPDAESGMRMI